ncbi:uncharacterized protein APUU_80823S [Aspergillus puulaauensis]|uniref:Uncharacterized protein n=1 Tax=Aspergillus puulaauensis TaxID=1220207 RepID=A0A7R8AV45_9EURO|nr:uncharacterized protein APUU_80823S [Aspergillus puulaauensis]BCS30520.1 hypothetical protein APUU_80823S [Aspergillus puulaauensis]
MPVYAYAIGLRRVGDKWKEDSGTRRVLITAKDAATLNEWYQQLQRLENSIEKKDSSGRWYLYDISFNIQESTTEFADMNKFLGLVVFTRLPDFSPTGDSGKDAHQPDVATSMWVTFPSI